MENIQRLYERLDVTPLAEFGQLEGDFFLVFCRIAKEKLCSSMICFMKISAWRGISLRSGVWTYYEGAEVEAIQTTIQYLKAFGPEELAATYTFGVHDYRNLRYRNCEYPETWINESTMIDDWIFEHELQISEWQRHLLLAEKDAIVALLS